MDAELDVQRVLSNYSLACAPGHIEALGNAGGFSGSMFWRFDSDGQLHCLRRWPSEHPDRQRLLFIHRVLRQVHRHGFQAIPLPSLSTKNSCFVSHAGHFWELTPWMPGEANYHQHPSRKRLTAALTALADFHGAAANCGESAARQGESPGIAKRIEMLRAWNDRDLNRLAVEIPAANHPELAQRAWRLVDLFRACSAQVQQQLQLVSGLQVPLQPCIRDIRDDHVLFSGDSVSGIIDFGSMNIDNVATDIARLLGTMAGDDKSSWHHGLSAYEARRPLSDDERWLVDVFDLSSVVLSGMNWLRWIYIEQRRFEAVQPIILLIDSILDRLASVVEQDLRPEI